ncbi:F-box domain [Arabidopsis thaliana x Arabidopsis arenosa]|uniref:F-box domain n=1 Tax=Arabidopsis thaliana x Arabidopsis arenosa TaxID=1240361 RepID=A0A8T2BIR2_9BRAS|nr:F-box domain [Arabidopsis thaliana x Arabidopsis arenosa]
MNAYLSVNERGRRILIDPVDRISQLPDNVLVMILKQMITEDAVRTSVLSKRWKSVWKQVPSLFFDMRYSFLRNMEPLPSHSNRVAKMITQVIKNHNGDLMTCIIQHYSHQCKDGELETWIQLLTLQKQTRALALSNIHCNYGKGANILRLSPNTFSHPRLTTLFLHRYELKTANAFKTCHNLKILKLENMFAEVNVFNSVIASCPSLKVLVLRLMWYNARACLKIHNNNLKLLHVASYYVHSIEVSAPLLDIFSMDYLFDGEYNIVIKSSRLFFTKNYGAIDAERVPTLNYNISYNARDMENLGHHFLVGRDATYLWRIKSLAVAVDVMNTKELEMFRQVLVAWNGIMKRLDIFFKHNYVYTEEGESSIRGTQKKKWEEENLFPNAKFRVEAVWMFNFSGLDKNQFEFASRFITQGTVMKKMMIKTYSEPTNKFYIEAAVAKLMELPKGNENLSIGYF